MDEVLDGLSAQMREGFQVDPAALGEHPRYSQFKNLAKVAEQQQLRRQERLLKQKEGRSEKIMKLRKLAFDDTNSDEEAEKAENSEHGAHTYRDASQRAKRKKYADQLMLSEWLVDIPEALSSDWTMVIAPIGKRALVVASKGSTIAYNKAGRQLAQFQSNLPGGNSRGKNQSWTILDCIYHNQTYFVLDLLTWNAHEYAENPYDFRQFMLQSKLNENPELASPSSGFRNAFVSPPKCRCSREEMSKLMSMEIKWHIDGLLFYHNSVIYEPGQSPLVGWLKPWMLPEILNVPIPERYGQESKGQTPAQYIESYNQKHKHHSKIDKAMEED